MTKWGRNLHFSSRVCYNNVRGGEMPRRNLMNGYYALRWKILERDNFTCQYCGQKAPGVILQVDHIIPVEEGGPSEEANLITACSACNIGKSALSIILKRTGRKSITTYVPPSRPIPPTWRQDEVYRFIKEGSGVFTDQIAKFFNINRVNVCAIIYRLKKRGLLKKEGHLFYVM